MLRLSLLLAIAVGAAISSWTPTDDCPAADRLYGKIQVVESFADCKVEIVDSFEDLRVQVVESFADEPGEWEMVESFPDYTVAFVESFPDVTIRYVESFPGPRD